MNRLVVYAALALSASAVLAQSTTGSTLGIVTKIDPAAQQIVLKTDAGAEITVALQPAASFRRVAPGETDLRNASTIAITDIHAGDRVLARGKASEDRKSVAATLIVVMSQSDIANKQASERADWDRRGMVGIVTAVAGGEITLNVREPGGTKTLIVVPAKDAVVRRYAPDSVKFVDAKPSAISEIRNGDQVRARGDKSPDGAGMTAVEIVSGSFRTIAATVNSMDAARNTMRVTNLDGKKPMEVKVNPDSVLRKLPAEMAQLLAGRGFGRGGGSADLSQMIDRAPKITLADLKAGDAIVVSSTVGASADQVTAITLVAGVEPILTGPGRKEMALGSWSLDMGGGAP